MQAYITSSIVKSKEGVNSQIESVSKVLFRYTPLNLNSKRVVMYAVEFQAEIKNGVVCIPEKYKDLIQNKTAKFIVMYEDIVTTKEKDLYKVWDEAELLQVGKIGFDSKSFVDDGEDYSKW